jgi:hypothetical protein
LSWLSISLLLSAMPAHPATRLQAQPALRNLHSQLSLQACSKTAACWFQSYGQSVFRYRRTGAQEAAKELG